MTRHDVLFWISTAWFVTACGGKGRPWKSPQCCSLSLRSAALLGLGGFTGGDRVGMPARDTAALRPHRQFCSLALGTGIAIGLIQSAHLGIARWQLVLVPS